MNKKDFITYFWGAPVLGALLGIFVALIFHTAELGIMVMLGIGVGYFALHTYILGDKFTIHEEKEESESL